MPKAKVCGELFFSLIVVSGLTIYWGGWYGVMIVVLFLLGAAGFANSGRKLGPIGRFIERQGVDDDAWRSKTA